MKEIIITSTEEGQRLDRILHRVLADAPTSFLYKMMRKKNITLNGKKPTGNEKVMTGDVIRLWFAEDTLEKFGSKQEPTKQEAEETFPATKLDILYEDENILLVNKPSGMLTQKAQPQDVSLNEYIIGYLLRSGQVSQKQLSHFRPSVCNRLDRNTSGIVAAGKTQAGLRTLSEMFRDRSMHKYYSCIVAGVIREPQLITGFLKKDSSSNMVAVLSAADDGAKASATSITPVKVMHDPDGHALTLVKVLLITGRTHQIRAHLSDSGHPIIGDVKYGSEKLNRYYRSKCGVKSQMLHAMRLEMPDGRVFEAPLPKEFHRVEELCRAEKPED